MWSVPHVELCKNAEYIEKAAFRPLKGSRSPSEGLGKVPLSKNGASGACYELGPFLIV